MQVNDWWLQPEKLCSAKPSGIYIILAGKPVKRALFIAKFPLPSTPLHSPPLPFQDLSNIMMPYSNKTGILESWNKYVPQYYYCMGRVRTFNWEPTAGGSRYWLIGKMLGEPRRWVHQRGLDAKPSWCSQHCTALHCTAQHSTEWTLTAVGRLNMNADVTNELMS